MASDYATWISHRKDRRRRVAYTSAARPNLPRNVTYTSTSKSSQTAQGQLALNSEKQVQSGTASPVKKYCTDIISSKCCSVSWLCCRNVDGWMVSLDPEYRSQHSDKRSGEASRGALFRVD